MDSEATIPREKTPDVPGYDRKMTRDEINDLPIECYSGPVTVVRDPSQVPSAIKALKRERILGFDTESRPSFKKGENHPVALVQLAGKERIYLFQLSRIGFPAGLRELLSDSTILKVGAGLDYDLVKLKELEPFEPRAFLDLGTIAEKNGLRNHGLRGMTAVLLGFRISKQAQRSNWGNDRLTSSQIRYAATDAWVSRLLFFALRKKGLLNGTV